MGYKKAIAAAMVIVGSAIMAVPLFISIQDRLQSEYYIEQMGVTDDDKAEEDTESETEGETGITEEKASDDIQDNAIGIIEIESLDIRYPIFEGAGSSQLNKGIGHLIETAGLLEKGNCVLAGHNGSRRGTFFTNLSRIEHGAKVKITDKNKVTHTYVVENIGITGANDASVKQEMDEEYLTLFTCANHGTQRFVCRCRPAGDTGKGR